MRLVGAIGVAGGRCSGLPGRLLGLSLPHEIRDPSARVADFVIRLLVGEFGDGLGPEEVLVGAQIAHGLDVERVFEVLGISGADTLERLDVFILIGVTDCVAIRCHQSRNTSDLPSPASALGCRAAPRTERLTGGYTPMRPRSALTMRSRACSSLSAGAQTINVSGTHMRGRGAMP